jgi:hypothetical protein
MTQLQQVLVVVLVVKQMGQRRWAWLLLLPASGMQS